LDAPAREDAFGTRIDDLGGVAGSGRRIALLDQQPVLLVVAPARAPRKADERPAPAELLAVQRELELALSESLRRIAFRNPMPPIPDEHRAAAVLALGDHAFERRVLERVILGPHRKALFARIEARALRDRPAPEHAVVLETKVVMEPPRVVLLHDELRAVRDARSGAARGLGGPAEVPFRAIFLEIRGHHACRGESPRRRMLIIARSRLILRRRISGGGSSAGRDRGERACLRSRCGWRPGRCSRRYSRRAPRRTTRSAPSSMRS